MSNHLVSINLHDEIETHLTGCVTDYATLCGLDGGLDMIGSGRELTEYEIEELINDGGMKVELAHNKATCDQCKAIWEHCKSISRRYIG